MSALAAAALVPFALVAIAAAALTVWRPAFGLCALIVTVPFDAPEALGPTTLTLPKAVLAGMLCGLAIRRASPRAVLARPIRALVLSALAVFVVTALASSQADYVVPALRETFKALEYLLAFLAAFAAVAADPAERTVALAFAAVTLAVALGALRQEATGAPSALLVAGRVVPRIAGALEGPNQLAGFFDVMLPLAIAFALRLRGGAAWLAASIAALAAATDVLTFSRAGLIAAFVAGAVVVLVATDGVVRRRAFIGIALVAVAAAAALGASGTLSRFVAFDEPVLPTGLGTRRELWHAALVLWRHHPLLGVGGGNYELELPRAGVTDAQTHANSLYLQSLAEGGIALLAANLATLASALRTFGAALGSSPFALGAFGATIALALHQIFDLLIFYPKVGEQWWLLLGTAAAMVAKSKTSVGSEAGIAAARGPLT